MAFYKKSDCGLILGFCIMAVLIVGNEALHEGYKRCRNYCHEELKASPYDCSIFCFFKCAPSMGGTGCFRSMGQQEQVLEIPRQFLVKAPAPEPTSLEQRTPKMNPKSDSNFNSDSGSNSLPSQSAISVPSSIEEKA
ncbi:uncharacterized protein LOC123224685 [Mangifera indica]|uniref:uncharacterized protein LOC123224685 n=1 Tax=Mangifera indica TaxID=29780 RepID=UPI001CFAAED7|nr:uncharacterized protein LOC123224685 [Mangifera indica]